jgi:D-lactate dehydrogenase (cytochrome)
LNRIAARPPRGEPRRPALLETQDELSAYLTDAARNPGGHAASVALPASEAELAFAVRAPQGVLVVGAQSSLTGGATPFGERVVSTARLNAIGPLHGDRVRVQAGVALRTLNAELAAHGLYYPPTPTFDGAFVGGAAATNAAGAASFKYGSTRDWILGLSVVLANGDVLDVERGACRARDGWFEIVSTRGETCRVPVPAYAMPRVEKRSAGYYAAPEMDLVDLIVGSEGTLGAISEVELGLVPAPRRVLCWLTLDTEAEALELAARLRQAGDVAAIESLDAPSLALLRADGVAAAAGVTIRLAPAALLITLETAGPADAAAERLVPLLGDLATSDALLLALPGDTRRAEQLEALREGVPLAINHRVEEIQRRSDPLVHKVAADMSVPFERLGEAMRLYRDGFARRGLEPVLFGHMSDGNIHANVIPKTRDEVRLGEQAILEFGARVIELGGCPMAEHGVGRNPVKQALLRMLYGDAGIDAMRRVKRALDPDWRLAPGVLFPRAE